VSSRARELADIYLSTCANLQQGIKKGVVELADAVIVNKADGDLLGAAKHAKAEYTSALSLFRPKYPGIWRPRVLACSATTAYNMDAIWNCVVSFRAALHVRVHATCGILQYD